MISSVISGVSEESTNNTSSSCSIITEFECLPKADELFEIESALERRTNENGFVEYLIKLQNIDKFEWVPASSIFCPELMQPTVGQKLNINTKADILSVEQKTSSGFKTDGVIDI